MLNRSAKAYGPQKPGPAPAELPSSPFSPPPQTLGDLDYHIESVLQTDSKMSEILLATDRKGRRVIFKIACVQQRARADANCRAIRNSVTWLQQLRGHRGIAQMQPIVRKGQSGLQTWFASPTFVATLPDWPNNPDFLITEFLPGGTLNSFVGKRPLPVDLALSLAHDLAQTIAFLHTHHCVHRDLKPENILFRVTPNRAAKPGELQPVLIDFGVAARTGEPKLVCGSRLWMAPELQEAYDKSLLPVDPTWDLYALGLICCYMLSGIRPRRKQYDYQDYADYQERVFAFLEEEAAAADADWQQLIGSLRQLLERTLHPDPRQRPTAAEFATAMAALLARMGVKVTEHPARLDQVGRWVGRLPTVARFAGLALVVIALLLVGFAVWRVVAPGGLIALQPASSTIAGQVSVTRAFVQTPIPATPLPAKTQPPTLFPTADTLSPTEQGLLGAVQTTATLTLLEPTLQLPTASPPTLVPLVVQVTKATPTLALLTTDALAAPTLVQATPVQAVATMTPTTIPPTATPLPPTFTATAVWTATATAVPSATRLPPTPTPQRQPSTVAPSGIKLLSPQSGVASAQERVEFAWAASGAALPSDQCYELVFWDPAKAQDKRSPIGAGRAVKGIVNLHKLRESPDPLLRTLAQNPQGFAWGVRTVLCTSPKTVVQDVSETRYYIYQP